MQRTANLSTHVIIFALIWPECHDFVNRPILAGMSYTGDVCSHSKVGEVCWPEIESRIAAIGIVGDKPGAVVSLCILEGPNGADREDGVEFQAD